MWMLFACRYSPLCIIESDMFGKYTKVGSQIGVGPYVYDVFQQSKRDPNVDPAAQLTH